MKHLETMYEHVKYSWLLNITCPKKMVTYGKKVAIKQKESSSQWLIIPKVKFHLYFTIYKHNVIYSIRTAEIDIFNYL